MSIPTLSIPALPTTGILATGSTASNSAGSSSSSSSSITSLIPTTSISASASSNPETTSLPPSTPSTTPSPSTSTSSSLISTTETSTTSSSNTPIPSTSQLLLQSTETSASTTTGISSIATKFSSVNGQSSTLTSLPTTLINSQSNSNGSISQRTAIIAGATTGFIALLLMILAGVFVYRRRKLRKNLEFSEKKKESRSLLGEEFDDDRNMSSYYASHSSHPAVTSTPSLLKSRTAETGSIFREEVWPPPGFVDPISKQSSQVDLGVIVDDIMGPSGSYRPGHDSASISTASYYGPPTGSHDRRQLTDASNTSTLSSGSTSSFGVEILDSDSFHAGSSTSSLPLPSGASQGSSSTVSHPTTITSIPLLPSPPRVHSRSPNTQPQKSSPLARDAKLWLTRSVRSNRSESPTPP